jgi:DnaJ-class molecular chaperone
MCELCHGIGCPACEVETAYEPCDECSGSGCILFDNDGELLTPQQYEALPEAERSRDACTACEGKGYVEKAPTLRNFHF